ncbi:MAG TPA: hypothetical protein DCP57_09055, partial [Gammaproteobacteria bacterium]|nr:hypothetical protein [Gammaproteobacteria bacterium]
RGRRCPDGQFAVSLERGYSESTHQTGANFARFGFILGKLLAFCAFDRRITAGEGGFTVT